MAAQSGADEAALETSLNSLIPADPTVAEGILKEVKHIFDRLGVTFFLRQGTCLGVVRENGLIPWDDDLDLGSVIGLHGFTEDRVEGVVAAFRENGFFARIERQNQYTYASMIKASVRVDWMCYRVVDDSIVHFPGVRFPARLFTNLKEVDFIGEKFCLPNPPEEYLSLKYGADWRVPKRQGFEKDVVDMIPEGPAPGRAGRLRQFLARHLLPRHAARVRVLDGAGEPVAGAQVVVTGLSVTRTNRRGYARFYLPYEDFYAFVVRSGNHEEVLYEEKIRPGATYVYRPDAEVTQGRYFALTEEDRTGATERA